MLTHYPHSERKIVTRWVLNFEHWEFYHTRIKTLKNTLIPNNEQNINFRIFRIFNHVLKALILCKHYFFHKTYQNNFHQFIYKLHWLNKMQIMMLYWYFIYLLLPKSTTKNRPFGRRQDICLMIWHNQNSNE